MYSNDGCVLAGSLSEEGLLLYLRALQTLLPLLPVSESSSRPEVSSDSEDDDDAGVHPQAMQVQSAPCLLVNLVISQCFFVTPTASNICFCADQGRLTINTMIY